MAKACEVAVRAARRAAEHAPHRLRRVAAEVGVGDTRLLEVDDVEEVVGEQLAHLLHRRERTTRKEGDAHPDDAGDAVGVQEAHLPHDERTPVVADEHRLLGTGVVEHAEQVVGEVDDVVLADVVGSARPAVAALVGCDDMEASASARAGSWWRHE